MTLQEIRNILERTKRSREYAEATLDGETDGYDGADGAREILDLCEDIRDLAMALTVYTLEDES